MIGETAAAAVTEFRADLPNVTSADLAAAQGSRLLPMEIGLDRHLFLDRRLVIAAGSREIRRALKRNDFRLIAGLFDHDLFRPAFARRSTRRSENCIKRLRACGKPAFTFRDHALRKPDASAP
jgi:hypothetical protein